MSKSAANSKGTAKARGKPWPKGVSGNPAGAPKRGESWAEIINRFGEMTPSEAAEMSLELAKKFLKIGDGLTLKQAVVLRIYAALLFEPDPRMFNYLLDRAEGKVKEVKEHTGKDGGPVTLKVIYGDDGSGGAPAAPARQATGVQEQSGQA